MKVKTSVTLSPGLIEAIDRIRKSEGTRSEFLERAAWEEIGRKERAERDARDIAILNAFADEFNAEAEASLALQSEDPVDPLGDEFTEDDLVHGTR